MPSRGTKNALLDMAVANARKSLGIRAHKKEEQKTAGFADSSGEIIARQNCRSE